MSTKPGNGITMPFMPKSRCSSCGFSAQPVGAACRWCNGKLTKLGFFHYMRLKKAGHKIEIPTEQLKRQWEFLQSQKLDPQPYFVKYALPLPQADGHKVA